MIKNYLKIAWRNIVKHKIYAAINIAGLAIGICACLAIYLITSYEFSFDKFHPDRERIYRITGEFRRSTGEKEFLNSIVSDLGSIQNDISGFESKAGIHFYYPGIHIPDSAGSVKKFDPGNDVIITWPEYFDIFKYEWIAGNASTALSKPYQVVLTENKAKRYFGSIPLDKIVGKTIVYDDSLQVSVSGIVKDWAGNTDFRYTDFISISTVSNSFLKKSIPTDDWRSLEPHRSMVFVKIDKKTTATKVNAQLADYIKRHVKPNQYGSLIALQLQPLSRIHFADEYYRGDDGDSFRKAHLPTLYILIGIAVFILVIASINFINLSTAQSIRRSKEIGVRKVLGSNRKSLVFQFLTETFSLVFFAVCTATLLINPVLTLFSSYVPPGVAFNFSEKQTLIFLIAIMLVTTLFAGFYPARVLSSYLPASSLRGPAIQTGNGRPGLRKILIVFQFTISLVFIIGALVTSKQINFMRNKEKGFKTDAVVTINNWGDNSDKMKILREKVKHIVGVDKVILQGTPPMGFAENSSNYKYKGSNEIVLQLATKMGDNNFIPFYQMKIIAGRNMLPGDSLEELVINEACSKAIGFTKPGDAIGKLLYTANDNPFPIVGVVGDFHMGSFRDPIKPVVIGHMPEWERSMAIKLSTKGKKLTDAKAIITSIEKEWKALYPGQGFEYNFLDESISWLYEKDKQTSWLMNAAMLITIFISCMGLFGLAMFTAESRTKEIGIRKVLGASVLNITTLLSKDFVGLVLVALVIASPLAWYFMNSWLRDFVYRTTISWWIFIAAGIASIVIAMLTVSFQAIKAAIANPVKSLRAE